MNASKQAAWLFCLLLALACSGFYFATTDSFEPLDESVLAEVADRLVFNLTLTQFDEQGQLAHQIKTPQVWHLPKDDMYYFKFPHLTLAKPDQTWEITSKMAQANHKAQEVRFTQQVVAQQTKGKEGQNALLKTEELSYFPKEKLAQSSVEVYFEQAGSKIHALGMKAYLEEKRVQLLGKTRATLEPKHG